MCISLWLSILIFLFSLPSVRLQCLPEKLVVYHVTMTTHWSRDLFPKQYPEFRPPAQWSKLVGRSHNSSYTLFRIGGMASSGLKKFAETSSSDIVDELSQGSSGIYDTFNAPPILQGVGQTQTQFFIDGDHTKLGVKGNEYQNEKYLSLVGHNEYTAYKVFQTELSDYCLALPPVSVVARIVPSPDWFVGIDSIDLCLGNEWIESIAIDVDPIDSGTDNGFTFTSPNWPTIPQEAIYHMHYTILHPAHSFHYPDRKRSKPIATLTFVKLKEFALYATSNVAITEESTRESLNHHMLEDIDSNDLRNELNEISDPAEGDELLMRAAKKKRSRKHKGRSRDCSVSEWSEWSECSALCGLGEQHRNRYITSPQRGGGSDCPSLTSKRLCSSARDCRQNYFDW